ncbi:hypothetical protein R3I93_004912 [Phoxinus phoxinus]|uniref:Ig-like domain-containing protein n=1 Tax=Phoxinus phoxinus TaxID=58324 RepID=A0AAN9HCA1_9TELE
MANSWILTVVVVLSIFGPGNHTRGEDIVSHQNKDAVIKKNLTEEIVVAGSDVTLWCVNNVTDVKWSKLIYILWNISMHGRKCFLGLSHGQLDDTCNDGKTLYNTSNVVSLFIPKISMEDEGFYSCDLSIKGGSRAVNVSVRVTRLETHLDFENGQRIAVCEATYKKTAPTLHWEPALNFSFEHTSVKKVDTFFIIENRVHLPDNVTISNLSCVASYPSVSGSLQLKSTLHIATPGECTVF